MGLRGILLDVDSAGGELNGLLDLGDLIFASRSKKPIFAVADDFALSAAYLLASAAERLYVTQTAQSAPWVSLPSTSIEVAVTPKKGGSTPLLPIAIGPPRAFISQDEYDARYI